MTNFSELLVFLCTTPTSMRFSFDRLMGIAERTFNQDPLSGHLFLFVNRYRNRIKILFWDRGGLVLYYKRLEKGRFRAPRLTHDGRAIEMDATELAMLLDGIDVRRVRRAEHWQPPIQPSAPETV